jgi:DtxR family Mn-dependent transcriptional regulator
MHSHVVDELLEAIWKCREDGIRPTVTACLEAAHAETGEESIQQMVDDGLIRLEGEDISLTDDGERAAAAIMRRHRLGERLFADVLGMSLDRLEEAACSFEHSVVPEVTEGLCTLLGHPEVCPHGKPIPPGACCKEGRREVETALAPLSDLPCGPVGKVAYVRPLHHDRLHMLLSMGISPGVKVRVHQRTPVLVVEVDQSEFAMDREVAEDVYVWVEPRS